MPRKNRRLDPSPLPANTPAVERHEEWRGEEYVVRALAGASSGKAYRCPGCDQEIRPGTPHLVAWPASDPDAGDRRHWHAACWAARDRRGPGIQRGRAAPRY